MRGTAGFLGGGLFPPAGQATAPDTGEEKSLATMHCSTHLRLSLKLSARVN
jgi:hypothetical protein